MEFSDLGSALFLAGYNIISGFCEYFLLKSIYSTGPDRMRKEKTWTVTKIRFFDVDAFAEWTRHFWRPGLSFALLILTVVGFDSITIGFLSSRGISEGIVG